MEVQIQNIPKRLHSIGIEKFIYSVVQAERHFVSGYFPAASTQVAEPAVKPSRGFYLRRIDSEDQHDHAFLTFASPRVACWFLEYAPKQNFTLRNCLEFRIGSKQPSRAFVAALKENATDKQPSLSVTQHTQSYRVDYAQIGHFSANLQFT